MTYLIIIISNFLVGGMIGICGIAGFLLPMVYAGLLGFSVSQSLTLSFFAFLVSGAVGSYNFYKQGNLDIKLSLLLGAGSFIGGILGVELNALIPPDQGKIILYLVVLLSGISILLRKDKGSQTQPTKQFTNNKLLIILLGIVTGCICSLSGAGGPVLVMPLLVILGVPVHTAIGVALFDSIFIAFPAFLGYFRQLNDDSIIQLLIVVFLSHGFGVLLGSRQAHKINHKPLKVGVAIFSIILAVYMIATQLIIN